MDAFYSEIPASIPSGLISDDQPRNLQYNGGANRSGLRTTSSTYGSSVASVPVYNSTPLVPISNPNYFCSSGQPSPPLGVFATAASTGPQPTHQGHSTAPEGAWSTAPAQGGNSSTNLSPSPPQNRRHPRAHPQGRSTATAAHSTARTRRRILREDEDFGDEVGDEHGEEQGGAGTDVGASSSGNSNYSRSPQQLVSEKRSREKLQARFNELEQVLPPSNRQNTRADVLDRAVAHIGELKTSVNTLQSRLSSTETELARVKSAYEPFMRNLTDPNIHGALIAVLNPQASTSQGAF